VLCVLPMPCQETERDANDSSDDPPCTPAKSTGNDGAGADNRNDSTESENSQVSDLPHAKQKRK
jgi:hypothetical protein